MTSYALRPAAGSQCYATHALSLPWLKVLSASMFTVTRSLAPWAGDGAVPCVRTRTCTLAQAQARARARARGASPQHAHNAPHARPRAQVLPAGARPPPHTARAASGGMLDPLAGVDVSSDASDEDCGSSGASEGEEGAAAAAGATARAAASDGVARAHQRALAELARGHKGAGGVHEKELGDGEARNTEWGSGAGRGAGERSAAERQRDRELSGGVEVDAAAAIARRDAAEERRAARRREQRDADARARDAAREARRALKADRERRQQPPGGAGE